MIYRIFAQKDTFITNFKLNNVQRTGSNFGASEILHVYKLAGTSGAVGVTATSSLSRILTKFDTSVFSSLTSSGDMPSSGVTYVLRLFDTQHDKTLPSSFDIEVQTVSQEWDEGKGHDVDNFSDKGFANWDKAKSNVLWSVPGASGTGPICTSHFDTGHENLEVDITRIVDAWNSGTVTNNGLLIKLSSSLENDYSDYYIKMFHGKETFFKDKRPHIEARWNDSTRDDRNNFFFGVTGSLFIHNIVNGQYVDITSVGTGSIGVRVVDASGTIATFTGSHTGMTGRYSASFALASGNYSGTQFNDIWFNLSSVSTWFVTGTFHVSDGRPVSSTQNRRYFVNVVDLKNEYEVDETAMLRVFVRPHDYNVARVLTASFGATGTVVDKAYYRIVNDRTDDVVVPFGTGSLEHTRLSYDENGNYMKVHMGSLSPREIYRISFLFVVEGQRISVDRNFKFRIV